MGLSSQNHQFWLRDAAGQYHEAVYSSRHGPHHPRAVRASRPGDQHGVAGLVRSPLGPSGTACTSDRTYPVLQWPADASACSLV